MIKDNKAKIKVNIHNKKHYEKIGINVGDISKGENIFFNIDVNLLPMKSTVKVIAICKMCKSENMIPYHAYNTNYNRNGRNYYSCSKFECKSIEMKKTNLERYGHEHYFQTKSVREGNKKWMSSDDFKEKSKETLIEKYGVDSYSKTDEFKKGITDNKKEIVNKIKSTFRDKYGVDWISQSKIWKEKYNLKYEIIRDKVRNTCISIYGVDSVSKVKEIMSRIMETKVKNGVVISNEQLSDWEVYKKSSQREINKIKNQLYEKWDGKDFYDGEYIKDNFRYGHTNRLYPTIDHKISVHYGFSNNIPVEEISDISNLCITKRYINCSKNKLNYYEFTI